MKLPGSFTIEGITYGRKEFLRHAHLQSEAGGNPEWRRKVFAFIADFLDPSTPELHQESSGTTGDPKSFILERESMLASARRTLDFFGLKPGMKVLLCLPLDYIAGKMMVVRALTGELDLVLAEPSGRPFRDLEEKVDFAALVPLQLYNIMEAGDDLSCTGSILCGGGELQEALRKRLRDLKLPVVYESFGMTETYTHIALKRINGERPDRSFRALESVKLTLDGEGCLVIGDPEISPEPVRTRDLVELDSDGLGFKWLGRADNVIKCGGIKIIPELLEQRIAGILERTCLVLPEQSEVLGQQLLLLVEQGDEGPGEEQIRDFLKADLEAYELPKRVVITRELPRNESMKPDRRKSFELFSK